jgi:hypothetical protein
MLGAAVLEKVDQDVVAQVLGVGEERPSPVQPRHLLHETLQ